MQLKKYTADIFKVLSTDETLLRLLIYQPTDSMDDPLDPSKQNIMDMDVVTRYNYINDRIYFTPSVDGLDTSPLCRIIFYPGRRPHNTQNYKLTNQQMIFDVFAHKDYNNVDMRCSWICDRINELIYDMQVTGTHRVRTLDGTDIQAPTNYTGYRLIYEMGSVN